MKALNSFRAPLCFFVFCAAAFGQTGNATLTGTVSDPSGAVILGAKVTVTNTATGVSRLVETTGAGLYVAPSLIPGAYKIEAAAAGFKTKVVTDLQLEVDQQARVDIPLEIG